MTRYFPELICLAVLFSGVVKLPHAQIATRETARKVDTYNDKIPSGEAEQWHLEDQVKTLTDNPETRLCIIAYGGQDDAPGKAGRFALRAKHYLVSMRGIDTERVVTITGGHRKEFQVELWIVPKGVALPKPAPTIQPSDDLGDNLLFDEFEIDCEGWKCGQEDDAAHLDGFAAFLKRDPKSQACIIAYAQSGDDRDGQKWNEAGRGLKIARAQKRYLVNKYGITPSRLTIVDGGYSWRGVALWIMR